MAKIIGLPKLSPTMDEGTLVTWAKKEGDAVEVDDLLAEVETDKATMEFRSFDKGVLLKILVSEGETLAPDTPVAILGKAGEDIADLVAEAQQPPGALAPPDPTAASPEAPSAAVPAPAPASVPVESVEAEHSPNDRIMASPLVRRIARERDIDLSVIRGTGPKGRIIKRDVEQHLVAAAGRTYAPTMRGEPRVEKVSQMRKTVARRLTEAKREVPHFYLTIDVDAEPILESRKAINAELERDGEKVSVNDMILKACAVALRRHPQANASFRGDVIHFHNRVDISVAVAMPDGLITPVVRDADRKGLREIALEVRELAARGRDKRLQPEEYTDGTFSISNLGMFGIEEFSAVINPPEGGILAVGAIREEPVVRDGAVVPGKRMRLTMSCDHRVIDGAVGAQFLAVLKRLIESPAAMLI